VGGTWEEDEVSRENLWGIFPELVELVELVELELVAQVAEVEVAV
jgi:hypothetical protein